MAEPEIPSTTTVTTPTTTVRAGTASSVSSTGGNSRKNLADATKERARSEADKHKTTVASSLKSVSSAARTSADELRGEAGWMASGLTTAADSIEDFAGMLQNKSPDELARDVQTFARQNPMPFLLGCAAAGFAVSRLFRASAKTEGAAS